MSRLETLHTRQHIGVTQHTFKGVHLICTSPGRSTRKGQERSNGGTRQHRPASTRGIGLSTASFTSQNGNTTTGRSASVNDACRARHAGGGRAEVRGSCWSGCLPNTQAGEGNNTGVSDVCGGREIWVWFTTVGLASLTWVLFAPALPSARRSSKVLIRTVCKTGVSLGMHRCQQHRRWAETLA